MNFKRHLKFFGVIYALALVLAGIGRLGLIYLDSENFVTYHYIAKSGVPTLVKLLSIFTGVQLLSILLSFGIALMIFLAGYFVFGLDSWNKKGLCPFEVGLVGLLNIIVSLLVFVIFFVGSLSKLQLRAMKSSGGGMGAVLLLVVLALITLFVAKAKVHERALVSEKMRGLKLIWGVLFSTLVSGFLTAIAFSKFNQLTPDKNALIIVLVGAICYNLALTFILNSLSYKKIKKLEGAK